MDYHLIIPKLKTFNEQTFKFPYKNKDLEYLIYKASHGAVLIRPQLDKDYQIDWLTFYRIVGLTSDKELYYLTEKQLIEFIEFSQIFKASLISFSDNLHQQGLLNKLPNYKEGFTL